MLDIVIKMELELRWEIGVEKNEHKLIHAYLVKRNASGTYDVSEWSWNYDEEFDKNKTFILSKSAAVGIYDVGYSYSYRNGIEVMIKNWSQ